MKTNILGRIVKGAAVISFFTLAVKVLGFFQKLVMARLFGTGMEADAYTVAFSSVVFTFCIIPHKLMAPFLPLFAERRKKVSEDAAWKFASSIATIVAVAMAATLAVGALWTKWIVAMASDFQSPATTDLAVTLVRIMLPASLFAALFALGTLILHADKRFAAPALAEFLNKAALIVVLVLLVRPMGIAGAALAVVAGSFISLFFALFSLRQHLHLLRFYVDWRDPSLREMARLVPPVLASILVAQMRTILDYRFASQMGEGYTSSLAYARALPDTLMLLVPFAVGITIYPFFSDMASNTEPERQTALFMDSMRAMAMIFVPTSIMMVALREPIIQFAFQRGRFDASSVSLTAQPLFYYGVGLTSLALEIIIMRFYFSIKDTSTPAIVGISCVIVHVGIVLLLRSTMLHNSIALATTISKSLKVIILYALIRNRLVLSPGPKWVFLRRLCAASAVMLAVVLFSNKAFVLFLPSSAGDSPAFAMLLARLFISALAGLIAYGVTAWALKMDEIRMLAAVAAKYLCRHGNISNTLRG